MRRPVKLFLCLCALTLAGCGRKEAQPQQREGNSATPQASAGSQAPAPSGRIDRSRAGSQAPDIVFRDPSGAPVTLARFSGKPLLVNLWATWCVPCITEMPALDRLAGREGERINVLSVSQDREGKAKAEPFFAKRHFAHLQPYTDPDMGLLDALKADTLPTTVYYDASGRELWRVTGMDDWDGQEAAKLIAEGLGR